MYRNNLYFEEDESAVREVGRMGPGVREQCVFNELGYFHVSKNYVVDFCHDILHGVWNYVGNKLLTQFTTPGPNHILTLSELNAALKDFKFEFSTRPRAINKKTLSSKKGMGMKMAETLNLILALPTIIGDVLPVENKYDMLLTELVQFVNLCLARSYTEAMLAALDIGARKINELAKQCFGPKVITFKFHVLTHYSRVVRNSGPIAGLSTMRLEGKKQHSVFKWPWY